MNIAILADIHANLHALEAVLRDLDTQRIDRLIINGDLVNRGPHNAEVIARATEAADLILLGNHDALVTKWIDHDDDIPPEWFDDPFWQGIAWGARQVPESGWLDTLRGLPFSHRLTENGAPGVLITHGSLRHYREGYGRFLNDYQLAEIVEEYPADIYVGAHTHRIMERPWGRHMFLNAGAVGAPFNRDTRAQYLILTLEDHAWRWTFRAVPYDLEAALAAYESTGYRAEGGVSADIFYEELRHARALYAPYWMWAEQQSIPKRWQSWRRWRAEVGEPLFEPPKPRTGPPVPDRPHQED